MRPEVRILGDPDIHVKEGSQLRLECVVTNYPQLLPFVSWFYNKEVGSYMQIKYSVVNRDILLESKFSCAE